MAAGSHDGGALFARAQRIWGRADACFGPRFALSIVAFSAGRLVYPAMY
jgi:hypothetical protein